MIKHGQSKTRLHRIWVSMRRRCRSSKLECSKYYYGKGIKVCPEWEEFINFYDWAIENNYSDSLTIDRIDSSGNYEPANCRWATPREQAHNLDSTIIYNGESARQASMRLGRSEGLVWMRINILKWSIEKAFTKPSVRNKK